ncbi:cyclopropane mycolic acid synthase family methyltransferase [Mycobacterium sp. CSUR Q5927]|nr:cyclopropane mycolic acid synthase family methyltransferase [Mycobacterium sp. CSUR Q5927]
MIPTPIPGPGRQPRFAEVQAHYELSDDFFALFLDPTRTYSSGHFDAPDAALEQAQIAKLDLHLESLDLRPGMTLLDIGCGWGSALKRAVERYDVNVIGLTLSRNQRAYAQRLLDDLDSDRSRQVLLRGWEEFQLPVDRIISIEALPYFGYDRYRQFFENCFAILPPGGRMSIQSIVSYHPYDLHARGQKQTFDTAKFIRFVVTEIFPGGRLPTTEMLMIRAVEAGFALPEALSLRPHYIRTLNTWGDALAAHQDEALEITSVGVYERYMRYLRGCAYYLGDESLDCSLLTYLKPTPR